MHSWRKLESHHWQTTTSHFDQQFPCAKADFENVLSDHMTKGSTAPARPASQADQPTDQVIGPGKFVIEANRSPDVESSQPGQGIAPGFACRRPFTILGPQCSSQQVANGIVIPQRMLMQRKFDDMGLDSLPRRCLSTDSW